MGFGGARGVDACGVRDDAAHRRSRESAAPSGETMVASLDAIGVQIYECRATTTPTAGFEWAFIAPEATLADANGRVVGTHGAGPHWQAADGSRIEGVVKARADAPGCWCDTVAVADDEIGGAGGHVQQGDERATDCDGSGRCTRGWMRCSASRREGARAVYRGVSDVRTSVTIAVRPRSRARPERPSAATVAPRRSPTTAHTGASATPGAPMLNG